jgi:hypothetical protein
MDNHVEVKIIFNKEGRLVLASIYCGCSTLKLQWDRVFGRARCCSKNT